MRVKLRERMSGVRSSDPCEGHGLRLVARASIVACTYLAQAWKLPAFVRLRVPRPGDPAHLFTSLIRKGEMPK